MITSDILKIKSDPIFFDCQNFVDDAKVYLKLEGMNIAGSIKLKTALFLINDLEKKDIIAPFKNKIIESSSGNLGVAMSIVCKQKGYQFTCVTDPNISLQSEQIMKLYGAEIIKVMTRDKVGGYLGTRINYIQSLIAIDKSYVWTNQYANDANIKAHYVETAVEVFNEIPKVDFIFIGAGTTGTLLGCANYIKDNALPTKVIAVDSIGSVTFGSPSGKRYIPGIGTSRRPELVDTSNIDDIILIHESAAVVMCHQLLSSYGLFVGGSTGSVMAAIKMFSDAHSGATIVAISPDFGHKYINTVYNHEWLLNKSLIEG